MVKKVLLLSSVLFVFCQMAMECFADAAAELQQARTYRENGRYDLAEQIYQDILQNYPGTDEALKAQRGLVALYIFEKRDNDVQAAMDKLTTDFSGHPDLPLMLRQIAKRYKEVEKYEEAESIYQGIVTDYSATDEALKAQKNLVILYISTKKDDDAQAALDRLTTDFSGHSELPAALNHIAKGYKEAKKHEEAKNIYQQIIQQYPGGSYAEKAQTALPGVLKHIAGRYEKAKKYEEAKSIYQGIIADFPDTNDALNAQLNLTKINAFSLIDSGETEVAQAVTDRLIVDFSENSGLPEVIYRIARRYERQGGYEEAKGLYLEITQRYPGSSYTGKAGLDTPKIQIFLFVDAGDDTAVQKALNSLIAGFNDHPYLPSVIFQVGEKYYNQAFKLENEGLDAEAKDGFRKAIAIWERIMQELAASGTHTAHAYYFSADCHRGLGEYEKSIECYQKVVDNWPDNEHAWDALFRVGRSYENLKGAGLISESEADTKIKAAYEQLLERYPACPAAKIAQRWLSRQIGNK